VGALRGLHRSPALREVEWRMARKVLPRIKVRAARDLVEWIQAEEAEIVDTLQRRLSGEIELVLEESYPSGKYSLLEDEPAHGRREASAFNPAEVLTGVGAHAIQHPRFRQRRDHFLSGPACPGARGRP